MVIINHIVNSMIFQIVKFGELTGKTIENSMTRFICIHVHCVIERWVTVKLPYSNSSLIGHLS